MQDTQSYSTASAGGLGGSPSYGSASSYSSASTGGISLSGSAIEMKVVKPEHFESVPQIADHLLKKRTVVLNLENTNKETARRLIDFLSGVAYSIDGSLKKIASNAYVITPSNVDVGDAQLRAGSRAQAPRKRRRKTVPSVSSDFADHRICFWILTPSGLSRAVFSARLCVFTDKRGGL